MVSTPRRFRFGRAKRQHLSVEASWCFLKAPSLLVVSRLPTGKQLLAAGSMHNRRGKKQWTVGMIRNVVAGHGSSEGIDMLILVMNPLPLVFHRTNHGFWFINGTSFQWRFPFAFQVFFAILMVRLDAEMNTVLQREPRLRPACFSFPDRRCLPSSRVTPLATQAWT